MKIIYLTNGIHEQNILQNNINIINKREKNDNNIDKNIIIYGGNQINVDNENEKVEENSYMDFVAQINKINTEFIKYILHGGLDLNTNCDDLMKLVNNYKKDKNFINIFNVDYKLINSDTIIIFLNDFFNITDNMDSNITSTYLKYLITLDPIKYKDCIKISDLVELEMDDLSKIIKKNLNVKTIIFATQTPLVVSDYINKKNNITNTIEIIKLFNRYSYLLNNLNLYWICGDLKSRNEQSTIKIDKKDNNGNKLYQLIIKQYIVGTKFDKMTNDNYGNIGDELYSQFEINMEFTNIKLQLDISYMIDDINKNFGYLELDINDDKTNFKINLEFIDTNRIMDEKKSQLEKFKKKILSQNVFESNIIDNVELSISDSNNEDINNQFTEEGDPYKSKYLKYKKKLFKLRNNKKY